MNPPALLVVLALEAEPRLYLDCLREGEELRLLDDLHRRAERDPHGLVAIVLPLLEAARAA